jgi:hypothetical protein
MQSHARARARTQTHRRCTPGTGCGGVRYSASRATRPCRARSPPRLRLLVAAARRRGARNRRPAPAPPPEPPSAAKPFLQPRRGLRMTGIDAASTAASLWNLSPVQGGAIAGLQPRRAARVGLGIIAGVRAELRRDHLPRRFTSACRWHVGIRNASNTFQSCRCR